MGDETAAELLSDCADALHAYSSRPQNTENAAQLGIIATILQNRFWLNRLAGLIESTPLGAEIALVWMRDGGGRSTADNIAETAKLLGSAMAGAAADGAKATLGSIGSAVDSLLAKTISGTPARP